MTPRSNTTGRYRLVMPVCHIERPRGPDLPRTPGLTHNDERTIAMSEAECNGFELINDSHKNGRIYWNPEHNVSVFEDRQEPQPRLYAWYGTFMHHDTMPHIRVASFSEAVVMVESAGIPITHPADGEPGIAVRDMQTNIWYFRTWGRMHRTLPQRCEAIRKAFAERQRLFK